MAINICRTVLLSSLLVLVQLASFAGAMGPSGHTETLEGDLIHLLGDHLASEGYMGVFHNGQDLERGISAYLWDSRVWFTSTDFNKSRKVDAAVCLMHKKGYPGFESYLEAGVVKNWCDKIVQQP